MSKYLLPPVFAFASSLASPGCAVVPYCDYYDDSEVCALSGGGTSSGDGDAQTGDGDGDTQTGDGDGDAQTGDGDGDAQTGDGVPDTPTGLELSVVPTKQFVLSWSPTNGAETYRIVERETQGAAFVDLGLETTDTMVSLTVPLHLRADASYAVQACNDWGCSESSPVMVMGTLVEGVGSLVGSNTELDDHFGWSVSLSADGNTVAIGATGESSWSAGIGGDEEDQNSNNMSDAGAVYVFERDASTGAWAQTTYIKPSFPGAGDRFGWQLSLSADGLVLAVSALNEDSGIVDQPNDNSGNNTGAVYVFTREDRAAAWVESAYVKAPTPESLSFFGFDLDLSADGGVLA